MEIEIFKKFHQIMNKAIKLCQDDNLLLSLSDAIDEFSEIEEDLSEIATRTKSLSCAIDSNDLSRVGVEVMLIRSSCMNINSVYENLAEVMSDVVLKLNQRVIIENEKLFSSLPIVEKIIKNIDCEMGSFFYDLQYLDKFDVDKFEGLVREIEESDQQLDPSLLFNLYTIVSNKVIYNADPNDGYIINNLSVDESQNYLSMLEQVVASKLNLK